MPSWPLEGKDSEAEAAEKTRPRLVRSRAWSRPEEMEVMRSFQLRVEGWMVR